MIINGQRYEAEPAVEAYVKDLQAENEEQRREILRLTDELKEMDGANEYLRNQSAKDFENVVKFMDTIGALKKENAQLEEKFQKATGVIAATDCVECQAWIDASIRQPDDNEGDVLVWYQCKCCGETSQSWGITFYNRGDWYKKHLNGECINVLFWHKLPKPPTRECNTKMDGGADNAK